MDAPRQCIVGGMATLSRNQILIYAVIGVVVLVVGVGWISSARPSTGPGQGMTAAGGDGEDSGGDSGFDGVRFGSDAGGGGMVVHVAGAVRKPGIYRLAAGARVADAIKRAGGANGAAMPEAINLAAKVNDGQQIVVPARPAAAGGAAAGDGTGGAGSDGDGAAGGTAGPAGGSPGMPLNLATATPAELEALDGIGPATAAKIVEFRQQRGGIGSVDELGAIHGIGPATIELLRSQLQP